MHSEWFSPARRESLLLAPYAMHGNDSAGRRHAELPHPYRGPYQRDRDRIVHSGAFRRLSYKTQVFTGEMGDYHRTRLTHTLEMASIARTLARALRINEDLVEALALAHDIGHPPFGHSGEDVLNDCLEGSGGFNHNAQALRILEIIERRYSEFPGLNLSREVLEGQSHRVEKRDKKDSGPHDSPLLEVQVVDAADSIAYDAHDADDALELGLISIDSLVDVPLWNEARERVQDRGAALSDRSRRQAIVHELIDWQVSDLLSEIASALSSRAIGSVADVRNAPPLANHSAALASRKCELEAFLFERVYRHPVVLAKRREAQRSLEEMFKLLVHCPKLLPEKFRQIAESDGVPRAVADYLAGMTDRYALEEHRRLCLDAGKR